MTKLAVFSFGNQEIRTTTDEQGEVWFVANDVCAALELDNTTRALERLDEDEQALISIQGISRGNSEVNIVNEPGLYGLVLGSRKPEAKRFKRWVTHEVLPAIRKTGKYVSKSPAPQRATATFPFKTQWYDCPPRSIEEDIHKVEMLAQFAELSRADKLTLLVKMVLQHDEYFATIVASARDRVKELDNVKDSPDAIEHSISAR